MLNFFKTSWVRSAFFKKWKMEEGGDFLSRQNEQDEQDALDMQYQLENFTYQKCIQLCAKNPRALIHPLPEYASYSSILHFIVVVHEAEDLRFTCQWLRCCNVFIGTHTYKGLRNWSCSLLYVACKLRAHIDERHEKVKILLEFGALFPEDEFLQSPSYIRVAYIEVEEDVKKKRVRVARATLVILCTHRAKTTKRTCFQMIGRDMTRLIAQEVFFSGLYLWSNSNF